MWDLAGRGAHPGVVSRHPPRAGLIDPDTVAVTTVHELQVRRTSAIQVTGHDVPVDLVIYYAVSFSSGTQALAYCAAHAGPHVTCASAAT
jgi:hypothetical protein